MARSLALRPFLPPSPSAVRNWRKPLDSSRSPPYLRVRARARARARARVGVRVRGGLRIRVRGRGRGTVGKG